MKKIKIKVKFKTTNYTNSNDQKGRDKKLLKIRTNELTETSRKYF